MTLSSIELLIARMRQVAKYFPDAVEFSAYLTTHQDQRYYGLDYEELQQRFQQHAGQVKSLSAACSGPEGRGVNFSLRFPPDSKTGEGQYVIVSETNYQNRAFSRMLLGTWEPLSPEDETRREALANLVKKLQQYLQSRSMVYQEQARVEQEAAKVQKERIEIRQERFAFDEQVSVGVILQLLTNLRSNYLRRAPFNIRLVSTDGESYSDIGERGLRRFFELRRKLVWKVLMDAATEEGDLLDIRLYFGGKKQRQNAEVEVISPYSNEIVTLIQQELAPPPAKKGKQETLPEHAASMVHEMFRFDQEEFALDQVIRLISAISTKYLQKEAPTVFLSTLQGETYPALTLRQLRNVYQQHEPMVSFLLFGMNQSMTGQTFSLMFQFESPGHEPYGSLSMMWGDHETHQVVRALIWEQLSLKPYRPTAQTPAPIPKAGQKQLIVNPLFQERDFRPRPWTCLVSMPLEAYWSESLWAHLQEVLKVNGFDSLRAEALFSENNLEATWTQLNEVDLIIADLTYKHPDVFYKLGVAHTLGKRILIISQHARDIPKDFEQFPLVVYDNNIRGLELLAEQLADWVRR